MILLDAAAHRHDGGREIFGAGAGLPAGRYGASVSLDDLIRRLEVLPEEAGRSFSAVGERLQRIVGLLRSVGDTSREAAEMMAAEDLPTVITALRSAVERLSDDMDRAGERGRRVVSRLEQVRLDLQETTALMLRFRERTGTLRMLKTLTKIQSVSLGKRSGGFQNVAADIGTLAQHILTKSEAVIEKTRELGLRLDKALGAVRELEGRQKQLAGIVVQRIRDSIDALDSLHVQATEAALEVSTRSAELTREIGEVVVAMQFHDITRQQIQHVCEALGDLEVRSSLAPVGELSSEDSSVCRLQAAQLTHTAAELEKAGADLVGSLRRISSDAAATSERAHDAAGTAGRVGESSVGEIGKGVASVLQRIADKSAADGELDAAVRAVTAAMEEIASFVEDIDYIGSEINLISLNAIIQAIQAGQAGVGLSVIAQTVKEQSEDICGQTAAITGTISRVAADLELLNVDIDGQGGGDEGEPVELLELSLVELRRISGAVTALLAEADRAAETVMGDVAATIDAVRIVDSVRVLRGELIPALVSFCGAGSGGAVTDADLHRLAGRYTMQSERSVHAAFGHGGETKDDTEGIGDNVEFF